MRNELFVWRVRCSSLFTELEHVKPELIKNLRFPSMCGVWPSLLAEIINGASTTRTLFESQHPILYNNLSTKRKNYKWVTSTVHMSEESWRVCPCYAASVYRFMDKPHDLSMESASYSASHVLNKWWHHMQVKLEGSFQLAGHAVTRGWRVGGGGGVGARIRGIPASHFTLSRPATRRAHSAPASWRTVGWDTVRDSTITRTA